MTTIKIAAVGDILMWERQIETAMLSNGTYSFDEMFKEMDYHWDRKNGRLSGQFGLVR